MLMRYSCASRGAPRHWSPPQPPHRQNAVYCWLVRPAQIEELVPFQLVRANPFENAFFIRLSYDSLRGAREQIREDERESNAPHVNPKCGPRQVGFRFIVWATSLKRFVVSFLGQDEKPNTRRF